MQPDPHGRRPFPIPVVALGPGSQPDDDGLELLDLPRGMATWQPPRLPEPEALGAREGTSRALRAVLQALDGTGPARIAIDDLAAHDRELLNQVLGEGEVAARWLPGDDGCSAQVQESVFAGVWRVVEHDGRGGARDTIEVAAVPALLRHAAALDALQRAATSATPPPDVLNAPHVLAELAQHRAAWRTGDPAQVVNLTLLPMSPADIAWMDHVLGTGRVLILSRGYGNCRITSTRVPHTWRVVYYNSQDHVILNTVEVGDLPAVAQAAPEDLADTRERLAEVLQWVAQA